MNKLVLEKLNSQGAILGWYNKENFGILKNKILLIFKMIVYKDREFGVCNITRVLNKLKMVKVIEKEINTNNNFNRNKWEPIRELFE